MADGVPLESCLKFRDAAASKLYFVSVMRHGTGEGASADLAVTDGTEAWAAPGLTSSDVKGQAPGKLGHLLAALSELEPARLPYKTEFVVKDGSMLVRVSWQLSPSDPRVMIAALLAPAQPAGPVMSSMLELLADNLTELRGFSQNVLASLKDEYEKQATRAQEVIDKYVSQKAEQDRETNTKMAALLNSKKKMLRDLQQQLAEAKEEIEALKAGMGGGGADADTQPMDEDEGEEEGLGAAGGARGRQQRGKRPAGKRVVVSEEEEEEDWKEGDEEESDGDQSREYSPERLD